MGGGSRTNLLNIVAFRSEVNHALKQEFRAGPDFASLNPSGSMRP